MSLPLDLRFSYWRATRLCFLGFECVKRDGWVQTLRRNLSIHFHSEFVYLRFVIHNYPPVLKILSLTLVTPFVPSLFFFFCTIFLAMLIYQYWEVFISLKLLLNLNTECEAFQRYKDSYAALPSISIIKAQNSCVYKDNQWLIWK